MRLLAVIFFIALMFSLPPPSWAITVLDDDFNNLDYVDTTGTTAEVDTANGWVVLPGQPMASAIDVRKEGWEYAVATKNGIEVYSYDDASCSMVKNSALSIASETTAIGVACRDDEPSIWALTPDSLTLYKYNAGGMQTSPSQKVTGLTNVLSVSAWNGLDRAALLSRTGDNKARVEIYRDVSGSVNKVFTLNTDLADPVAICTVPNTPDFILATKTVTYYYCYDDATGGYVQHPAKYVLGLSGLKSASARDDGSFVALENSDANYYMFLDSGGAARSDVLSKAGLSSPVSVSIKPGEYEYAVLSSTGSVDYWMYDGAGMVKNSSLSISGLSLNQGYLSPAEYRSKAITTAGSYDEVKITAAENLPAGTEIKYYVSTDGGASFTEVQNGVWKQVPAGNNFVARAVLSTTDPAKTPRVLHVKLEVTTLSISNLRVISIAANEPGQTLPTSTFPVRVKVGAMVLYEVSTSGYAESVNAAFTIGPGTSLVPMTSLFPVVPENNTWRGTYVVPSDAVEGATIGITLTAAKDTIQKQLIQNPFILVNGNVLDVVDLSLMR
ncbi:MAG: hypothetical protein HPY89_05960 [Pelotomaculum sp.]|nr:hypothetical protein [Pelotomaculum sp.]